MSTNAVADVEKGHTEAKYERAAADASPQRHYAVQGDKQYGIRPIGNPGPLGLFSFASTTLILSLYNVNVRHVNTPNVVVGMALGVGGLAQLLAGQWEFVCGNTFGATAFSSYGGFWISFALIYWPGSGILDAFNGEAKSQLNSAVGVYLITWFIVTFLFLIASIRSHLAFVGLFGFLSLTFILLAIGSFLEQVKTTKAGGAFGIVTAFIAYYTGASGLITPETSYFGLPLLRFKRAD